MINYVKTIAMYCSTAEAASKKKYTNQAGTTGPPPPAPEALVLEVHTLKPSFEVRLCLVLQRHGKSKPCNVYRRCPHRLTTGTEARHVDSQLEERKLHPNWPMEPIRHFSLQSYELVSQILQRDSIIPFVPIPAEVLSLLRRPISDPPSDLSIAERIGTDFWNLLRPFQKETVRYAIPRNGCALLADEMGLGKTMQALAVASYYVDDGPCLIICPSSLRYGWLDHAVEHTQNWKREEIVVLKSGKDQWDPNQTKMLILTYGLLLQESVVQRILAHKFTTVILDESHYIKDGKSKRTKQCLRLCATARHRLLLSGTPMPKGPVELFTQLKAIDPNLFPLFWPYKRKPGDTRFYYSARYCNPILKRLFRGPPVYDHSGESNSAELNLLLKKLVMVLRRKREVAKDLPKKNRERLILGELHGNALVRMQAKMAQISGVREEQGELLSNPMFLDLVRRTTAQKIPLIREYLKDVVWQRLETDSGCKYLLFGHSRALLDALQEETEKAKWGFIRIDGSVLPKKRADMVDSFQNDPTKRVAILSLCAAGVGLTLTRARHVVMAELLFGLDQMLQAEDRSHRIGQTESVSVVYLMLKGSTDDTLWRMIQRKGGTMGRILHDETDKFMAPEVRGDKPIVSVGQDDENEEAEINEADDYHPNKKSRKNPTVTKRKRETTHQQGIDEIFKRFQGKSV
jgi:SWI/SNF-related matrix-associated actin-dependent regulator 1 of chromatin subfamily A